MKNAFLIIMAMVAVYSSYTQEPQYCSNEGAYWSLQDALKEPEKVISLNLSLQQLKALPPEIEKFINLECLDVSYNELTDFPKEITKLNKLRYLKMAGLTNLNYIPRILKQIPSLKVIDISDFPNWKDYQFDDAIQLLPKIKFIRNDIYIR